MNEKLYNGSYEFLKQRGISIFIITMYSLLITLTVVGNLLVIITFAKDETVRGFSDYFILNLAIVDFIIGCVCVPPYIPYLISGVWTGGKVLCKAWLVLDYMAPAASTLCICVITLDRYLHVYWPMIYRSKQRERLKVSMMLSPWIITFVVYFPAIAFWELVFSTGYLPDTVCILPYHDNLPYLMFGASVEFFIPMVIICIFNLLIFLKVRSRSRIGIRGREEVAVSTVTASCSREQTTGSSRRPVAAIPPLQTQHSSQDENIDREAKLAKALFILVFSFVVCWMPYEIMSIMSCIKPQSVNPILNEVGIWMLWCNAALNPVLYPFLHPKIRAAFRKLFRETCPVCWS